MSFILSTLLLFVAFFVPIQTNIFNIEEQLKSNSILNSIQDSKDFDDNSSLSQEELVKFSQYSIMWGGMSLVTFSDELNPNLSRTITRLSGQATYPGYHWVYYKTWKVGTNEPRDWISYAVAPYGTYPFHENLEWGANYYSKFCYDKNNPLDKTITTTYKVSTETIFIDNMFISSISENSASLNLTYRSNWNQTWGSNGISYRVYKESMIPTIDMWKSHSVNNSGTSVINLSNLESDTTYKVEVAPFIRHSSQQAFNWNLNHFRDKVLTIGFKTSTIPIKENEIKNLELVNKGLDYASFSVEYITNNLIENRIYGRVKDLDNRIIWYREITTIENQNIYEFDVSDLLENTSYIFEASTKENFPKDNNKTLEYEFKTLNSADKTNVEIINIIGFEDYALVTFDYKNNNGTGNVYSKYYDTYSKPLEIPNFVLDHRFMYQNDDRYTVFIPSLKSGTEYMFQIKGDSLENEEISSFVFTTQTNNRKTNFPLINGTIAENGRVSITYDIIVENNIQGLVEYTYYDSELPFEKENLTWNTFPNKPSGRYTEFLEKREDYTKVYNLIMRVNNENYAFGIIKASNQESEIDEQGAQIKILEVEVLRNMAWIDFNLTKNQGIGLIEFKYYEDSQSSNSENFEWINMGIRNEGFNTIGLVDLNFFTNYIVEIRVDFNKIYYVEVMT